MQKTRYSLLAAICCGLIAAPFGFFNGLGHWDGWPALCAALSGALGGRSLLGADRADRAALHGLAITFGAFEIYTLVLSCQDGLDMGNWLNINLLGLIRVGWLIFPVGALAGALLWTLNLRMQERHQEPQIEQNGCPDE